jgi:hypothetical protein
VRTVEGAGGADQQCAAADHVLATGTCGDALVAYRLLGSSRPPIEFQADAQTIIAADPYRRPPRRPPANPTRPKYALTDETRVRRGHRLRLRDCYRGPPRSRPPVPYAKGHVEVRVQVARERRPRRTCGVGELGLRDVDDSVDVQPPERRGDDHSNCVAAILGVSRGSPAAPTPMAIIDSPRAAIMISPVSSTKWAGERRHPGPCPTCGLSLSTASAAAHRARSADPSKKLATTSSDGRGRRRAPIGGRPGGAPDRRGRRSRTGRVQGAEEEVRDPEDDGLRTERPPASRVPRPSWRPLRRRRPIEQRLPRDRRCSSARRTSHPHAHHSAASRSAPRSGPFPALVG